MFWLKKLLGTLTMPLSLVLILQITAVALLLARRRKIAATFAAFSLGLLVVASNEGVADRLVQTFETQFPPAYLDATGHLPAAVAACPYIAVLGGGHNSDSRQSPLGRLSGASLGRLTEAVRLARLLPDAELIVCGPFSKDAGDIHANVLAAAAIELGIAPDRIRRLSDGLDTHDEVLAIQQVTGPAPVALVTSAWHMPRAMGLAAGAHLNAVPCPADFAVSPIGNGGQPWLKWSLGGLDRSTKAVHETLGLIWTRLRGQR